MEEFICTEALGSATDLKISLLNKPIIYFKSTKTGVFFLLITYPNLF